MILALMLIGGGAYAAYNYINGNKNTERPDLLLHTVKLENLDLTVVERGTLESAENKDVICQVKATSKGANSSTTIRWVIDDGTHVKQGQLIAILDSSALEDQYRAQKIIVDQAEGAYIEAAENYKIVVSQNESDEETARIAIQLAELDLEKYAGLPKGTISNQPRAEAKVMLAAMEQDLEKFLKDLQAKYSTGGKLIALKGEYQQLLDDVSGRIELAEADLEMWKDRAGYSQRMQVKGFLSASQVQADESRLASATESLKKVRTEKDILQRFTAQRMVKDLSSKVQEAWRAFDRVKVQARAKELQAATGRDKKKSVYDEEKLRLEEVEDQIQVCKIHAPQDGMVVYFIPEQSRYGSGSQQSIIAQGEPVREGQKLMRIPDLRRMQVSTRVHEAMVSRIRGDDRRSTGLTETIRTALMINPFGMQRLTGQHEYVLEKVSEKFRDREYYLASEGQKATVRVDAFADRILTGHVKTVATVAAASDWMSSDVKVYQTIVSIDESLPGLKPGMSAEVTIQVEKSLEQVPAIPVQAIIGGAESGRSRKCYIMTPNGPEEREIIVGLSNDKMAEIKDGLKPGDLVIINPKAILGDKAKTHEPTQKGTGDWKGKGGMGKGMGGMPNGGMPNGVPNGGMPTGDGKASGKGMMMTK